MSDIVYLKLIGEQQGDISDGCGTTDSVGNRWQRNHVNEIFVFSLSSGVTNTGKGANLQSLTFSKQIDKSSPLLANAINNNENLFLAFWFYRINRYGQWEKYYYIQLRGASISRIQLRIIKDEIDTETISVDYDYILSKHLISNTECSYLALPAEYNKLFVPTPKAQTHTLNSAGVGRLLAAGGIYNGNVGGFRDTAEKLGGDAVEGYDQILNEKTVGVAITAASIAAVYGLGRVGLESEVRALEESRRIETRTAVRFNDFKFSTKQLQKKFKHAIDFGISGTTNKQNLVSFENAVRKHMDMVDTIKIKGKYRWDSDVCHYFNPSTNLNVMTDFDGNFISGWKLSERQRHDLLALGNVF
ncbi:type VI secretion system tube protein Hcp [Citrobacter koseri]|uniref:type VI secretion system tube protein TssD n=1 Tax=Citrobacter TaxID=544 RepID=UPI0009B8206A|nr:MULTISPECIES: type VI secretion system tube protein TssD [Citrobacter]EKX8767160.1 type VI secretion system tube protein Hcp [Citrobacter koseri]MBJ9107155.1 type VI secretion system tube protein Hcp [Citrobacter koseri]MBJ9646723.1 type VI secretion system tube protein Hcp [Citrobacter koseri]MDM3010062.1 type VI secretion system tube protein Hcp [Citrobacter sp. CK191]PNO78955.1 type VI secretion system tube protein Hcp [Citrobacter koseri]